MSIGHSRNETKDLLAFVIYMKATSELVIYEARDLIAESLMGEQNSGK